MIIFFSTSSAPTQVLPAALVDRPPAARAPRPLPRSDHVRRMNDATLASTRIESGVPIRRRPVGSRASERSIKWSSDDDDDDGDDDDDDDDGGGGGGGSDVCAARGGRRAFPHLSTQLDLRAELLFRARIVVQPLELVTTLALSTARLRAGARAPETHSRIRALSRRVCGFVSLMI